METTRPTKITGGGPLACGRRVAAALSFLGRLVKTVWILLCNGCCFRPSSFAAPLLGSAGTKRSLRSETGTSDDNVLWHVLNVPWTRGSLPLNR